MERTGLLRASHIFGAKLVFVDHTVELMDIVKTAEHPSSKQMCRGRGGGGAPPSVCVCCLSLLEVHGHKLFANGCAAGPHPVRTFHQLS